MLSVNKYSLFIDIFCFLWYNYKKYFLFWYSVKIAFSHGFCGFLCTPCKDFASQNNHSQISKERKASQTKALVINMKHVYLARHPLGNPRRIWKQDNYVLSTFSPTYVSSKNSDPLAVEHTRRAVETCYEAGFNLLELGWARPEQSEAAIHKCEELGIDIIYQNLEMFGGMQKNREMKSTRDALRKVVDKVRPLKHTIGYYVWDEPCLDETILEARRQMDIFQQEDPNALLFVVAIPSYNKYYTWQNGEFEGYMRRYCEKIDPVVLSLDYYPIGMANVTPEAQLDNNLMWCDLGIMWKLAAEYEMPMWFYYQGQNLRRTPDFAFPQIRMMMYAAAMYGAKGLQHYTAWEAVVDLDGGPGIFFEDQKKIHKEFHHLGKTLMALDCKKVFHDAKLLPDCPYMEGISNKMSESKLMTGELQHRTSVSELEDEYGNDYMIVLNRDYIEKRDIEINLKGEYRLYEVSKADGMQRVIADKTDKINVTLEAGDAVLYRLQKAEAEAYTIEYVLEK